MQRRPSNLPVFIVLCWFPSTFPPTGHTFKVYLTHMNEHLCNPLYFSTSQPVLPQLSVSYLVFRGCFWEENPVSPSSLCSTLTPACFYVPPRIHPRLSARLPQAPHCLLEEQNQALFECARDADDSSGYSSLTTRRFLWFLTCCGELDDCEAKKLKSVKPCWLSRPGQYARRP